MYLSAAGAGQPLLRGIVIATAGAMNGRVVMQRYRAHVPSKLPLPVGDLDTHITHDSQHRYMGTQTVSGSVKLLCVAPNTQTHGPRCMQYL